MRVSGNRGTWMIIVALDVVICYTEHYPNSAVRLASIDSVVNKGNYLTKSISWKDNVLKKA